MTHRRPNRLDTRTHVGQAPINLDGNNSCPESAEGRRGPRRRQRRLGEAHYASSTSMRRSSEADQVIHHIHHIMSAKPSQPRHRPRPRRITSPAPHIIPPNRHPHIASPHRTDCNTRTTTPGTHSTVTITSSKIEPRPNQHRPHDRGPPATQYTAQHDTVTNTKTEPTNYPSTQFAFAMSEQQSKIEKKEAMDTNSKTAGTQKTPSKTGVNNRKKNLLIQQGRTSCRRRRPQVWLWKKKKAKKKEGNLFGPFFPLWFLPSSPSLSFSSLSVDIIPNADYPPRCPTQVTHHPSLCVSSLFIPPEYTKDIHAQDRPFKSEHSSSRAQNATPSLPPHSMRLSGPLPSGCLLLQSVVVAASCFPRCVCCVRPVFPSSPPECRRKKKKEREYYEKK